METVEKSKYGIVSLMSLLFFIVFVLLNTITVQAEELQVETGSMEGVLQAGNLLKSTEAKFAMYSVRSGKAQTEQMIINAIEQMEVSVDISKCQIQISDVSDIVRGVLNNNPQYFYVKNYKYYYSQSSGNVISLEFTYYNSASELKIAYEANVYSLLAKVNDSWSDMEKVVFINDYIASHCAYDEAALQNSPAPHTYDAYGALVNGRAVCQGYAEAFQDLMNRLDVPCEMVTSKTLNHAWNMVQIGNHWYHVDVTWNDPVSDLIGRARHYYLLKSTSWFQDENKGKHNASDYVFSGSETVASATSTVYDDYFWNDIDTSFVYAAGDWYGLIKSTGKLNQYSADASGFTFKKEICTISDKWFAEGNSYYIGCFSSLSFLNGSIYYSTPKEVCAYNLSTGIKSSAYTLTNEELASGYIYGMVINDGILTYGLSSSPNVGVTKKTYILHRHNYISVITKNVTCTENGIETRKCENCGEEIVTVIPAAGHTPGEEATCTEAQTCMVCQEELEAAKGHTPGEEATCTKAQTCMVCQEELEAAKGHTPGEEATCTKAQICTVCQKELKAASGHDYEVVSTLTEATCIAEGSEKIQCRVCQNEETRKVPKKGHIPGEKATCTKAQTCTVCQKELKAATGHQHTHTEIKAVATFTKAGKENVICEDCGKVIKTGTLSKEKCRKNQTYQVEDYEYKILNPDISGKGTVIFTGLKKNVFKVTIGDTVTILGAKFKIVQIGDQAVKNKMAVHSVTIGKHVASIGKEAFSGAKNLKTITIKSTKLKKIGKNAFYCINAKAKLKVPKSKLKKYQSLLRGKGQRKTVKIVSK